MSDENVKLLIVCISLFFGIGSLIFISNPMLWEYLEKRNQRKEKKKD